MNPFVVVGSIPDEYFCDRQEETRQLVRLLTNNNNVVLISPRRMGKTGLIHHVFSQREISESYYTFFVDIMSTTSFEEFVYRFGKNVFDSLRPRSRKMTDVFVRTLKSLQGCFGYDGATGLPTFSINLGDIERADYTLDEIFEVLESADRPCLVAIDEFQQITNYKENNIEALLRTHVQRSSNSNFIFSGSERHMMQEMFLQSARPFYNSASLMELQPISKESYCEFAREMFSRFSMTAGEGVLENLYTRFGGQTYCLQRTLNTVFSLMRDGDVCDEERVAAAVDSIVESNGRFYEELMLTLSLSQKKLLCAVAREGEATNITSGSFVKKHKLLSTSSVQASAEKLVQRGYLTRQANSYCVNDKFWAIWLQKM